MQELWHSKLRPTFSVDGMKVAESYIYLKNVRFHAFHGVTDAERTVGSWFLLNMRIGVSLEAAMQSDVMLDTISYADIYKIVKTEMLTESKLVENAAWRIANAVCDAYPQIKSVDLKLMKENPPMGALCDGAGVEIHFVNDEENM